MLPWILSLGCIALFVSGGTLLTYFYDEKSKFWGRLAFGATLGTILFSLLTFAFASFWGLTPLTIAFAAFGSFAWPLVITARFHKTAIQSFQQRKCPTLKSTLLWLPIAAFLIFIYVRGFFEVDGAIRTGMTDNYADLALHLGIVNGFVFGDNFPPEHPAMATIRLSYPFLMDFNAAIFVKLGLSLSGAFLLQNLFVTALMIGLLIWLTRMLTQDRLASYLAPVLLLFNGGMGWMMLFGDVEKAGGNWLTTLHQLPHEYTSFENIYRFNNSLIYWFIPMRSMLLATPLLCCVWILWFRIIENWRAAPDRQQSRLMIGAGVLTGLMPLVHAHSFVALMAGGALLALLFRHFREWILYAITAITLALPQILMVTSSSGLEADKFFGWEFGWTKESFGFIHYWFLNSGFFIPVWLIAGIWLWRKKAMPRDALLFLAPFALWFVIPNVTKLAPWIWDNIKILYIWFLGAIPIVAAILSMAWKAGSWKRGLAVIGLISFTLSSALDYYRQFTVLPSFEVYSSIDARFASLLRKETSAKAIALSAPVHNSHVILAGHRLFMGYAGVIWTHGISAGNREEEIRAIYEGAPNALEIIARRQIKSIIVTPKEVAWAKDRNFTINTAFLDRLPHVALPDPEPNLTYTIYKP